jgi:RimJ/RimL family protein N-acetyltransferase
MPNDIFPEITTLETGDIPHLIDCVRRCYGESYPNPLMYDAAQLKDAIEKRQIHSVIAKIDNDHIIGHCALTFSSNHNTSPEAGKMMVDPNFRGHHIAESIAKKRIEIAESLGLPGFWTECVTNHPYSQHEMIALDAKETGLFIGDIPPTFTMQGLENHPDTRMSLLAFYLPLKDHPNTIYSPPEHIEHLKALVDSLNMTRDIKTSNFNGTGKTKIKTEVDPLDQTANISISHIGEDLIAAVKADLEKIEVLNLATVYLDLPIEQEAAARAYSDLEQMGFFWGSWIPNYTAHKDILRLQKIYQDVDTNTIVCAREAGEIVKHYVLSEWARVSQRKTNI